MSDRYTDDLGNEITCANCDVTAKEWFEYVIKEPATYQWMVGSTWYCSTECYEEKTRDEG